MEAVSRGKDGVRQGDRLLGREGGARGEIRSEFTDGNQVKKIIEKLWAGRLTLNRTRLICPSRQQPNGEHQTVNNDASGWQELIFENTVGEI